MHTTMYTPYEIYMVLAGSGHKKTPCMHVLTREQVLTNDVHIS
jgi:hypothetical protein